ncbi:hypothetical protein KFK09_008988 [Dendrobium nobile]|uniref:Uncharacterized protein n=1 Tax=Dendrobium nobile TaxID=94219 RepID=A0A8T3BR53_DENNO|nr:hypothetical protein KFK09_008988 [Dendrobium nobile]
MKWEDQKTHYNNYHNNLNITSIKTPKSSPLLTEISPKPGTEEQPRKPRRPRGNQGGRAGTKGPWPRERAQARENQRPAGIPWGKMQNTKSQGGSQRATSWGKENLGIPKAGLEFQETNINTNIKSIKDIN